MRPFIHTIVFLSLTAAVLTSCEGQGGEDPATFESSVGTAILGHEAGAADTVQCTFADAWQITGGDSDCDVSPASGQAGPAELIVTAPSANPGLSERESYLIILDGESTYGLHIIQKGTPGLRLQTSSYSVTYRDNTLEIPLDANLEFEPSADADWLQIGSVTESEPVLLGDGKTVSDSLHSILSLNISANPGPDSRTAVLTLSTSAGDYEVSISQAAPLTVDWSKEFFRRSTILKFTATWCYNCPVMGHALNDAQAQMPDRLIQMSMYGANSEGGLTYWQCSKFQGSDMYGVEGFPTGIANNFVKVNNSRDLDLTEVFTEIVNEAAEKYPASTGIRADMSVSEGKVRINADIAVKQQNDYKICVFLVESGIIYPQEGDARDYEHNFVVREVLTDNVFGDPLASVGAEEVIEYTLEADLPRSVLVPENTSVIIAVARPGSADSAGSLTYPNVTYMDLDIYDNAVIVPANGSVDLAYEE